MTSLAQMVQLRLSGMAGSPREFAASRLAAMLGRTDLPIDLNPHANRALRRNQERFRHPVTHEHPFQGNP